MINIMAHIYHLSVVSVLSFEKDLSVIIIWLLQQMVLSDEAAL